MLHDRSDLGEQKHRLVSGRAALRRSPIDAKSRAKKKECA
jgi:hypothetical protein